MVDINTITAFITLHKHVTGLLALEDWGQEYYDAYMNLPENLKECIDAAYKVVILADIYKNDNVDAIRYRKIVAASEMAFPLLSICEDPENEPSHKYGRDHIDSFIDNLDEIQPVVRVVDSQWKSTQHPGY